VIERRNDKTGGPVIQGDVLWLVSRSAKVDEVDSLVLIHGAGTGPDVFDSWAQDFPGIRVAAVDLQEGLDVGRATMNDYADRLVAAAHELPRPMALCGWSMGGLVALMGARSLNPAAVVLLEPSPPAEAQGFHPEVEPIDGTFDPEDVYGQFPPGMNVRLESLRARADRKTGISVPNLLCPSLVVCSSEFAADRGQVIAYLYDSRLVEFPNLDHWGLVRNPKVREVIAQFLSDISSLDGVDPEVDRP
jgi:pimeloyl-ACP methyl ester carboxylesterase